MGGDGITTTEFAVLAGRVRGHLDDCSPPGNTRKQE